MKIVEGKKIVITGAGRGLGRAMAIAYSEAGADVAIIGRGAQALEKTVAQCGGKARAFPADLGVGEQVETAFAGISDFFGGKLDVLINNAAIIDFFRIDETDPERIQRTVNANLLGPMFTARFAAPLFKANGQGDLINISSETVRNPYSFMAAYGATKAGLENLSRGLREELKKYNVRVSTLQIGVMADTEARPMDEGDMVTMQRFMEENQAQLANSGGEMQFSTVIYALASMLSLPREASYEMVELRPLGLGVNRSE